MDQLFRGRPSDSVRGVSERVRHDAGGRPLRGTSCTESPLYKCWLHQEDLDFKKIFFIVKPFLMVCTRYNSVGT